MHNHRTQLNSPDQSHFDGLCCVQLLRWGDPRLPLPQQLEDEVSDVTAGNGDVLDAATNDVTLSTRDDMGDTVTGVNDSSSESSLSYLS